MIFVTVGTTKFPFYRMGNIIHELIDITQNKERIIIQQGKLNLKVKSRNVSVFSEIPHNKFLKYIKEARVIITHGGPATIFQILAEQKKPFVLPRLKKFGEHVNDHQKYFSEYLGSKQYIYLLHSEKDLKIIASYTHQSKKTFPKSDINKIVHILDNLVNDPTSF